MLFYAHYIFWISWFLIIYTYVFFPILINLAARASKAKSIPVSPEGSDYLPKVCMVVASYNEAATLPDKLKNTWEIDYPADKFRLVIGSDGSSDASHDLLNACKDKRLLTRLFTERRGKISVLNDLVAGITENDAEILVFSDANTMFAPDALKKLVAHFQDLKVGCVSGELKLEKKGGVSGEGFYWRYENWIKKSESHLGFLIGCNGGIFALRRELYEPLPANTIVEDFVITLRILEKGWNVVFEPDAVGVEPPAPSSRAEMVRKIRIGAGNFQALFLTHRLLGPTYGLRSFAYWGHKVIRWFVPVFLITAFAANLLLLSSPFFVALLLLQLTGFIAAYWSYFSIETKPAPKLIRLCGYFYLMNYAIFCGLLRFLRGNQRVTWERASR